MANVDKAAGCQAVRQAAQWVAASGREIAGDAKTVRAAGLRCAQFETLAELARHAGLLLVFGGDGTILQVARETSAARAPVLGVNVGRLGFLTAVSIAELEGVLERIWQGRFEIEARLLLEARGQCLGKPLSALALNDIVVSHGAVSRLGELEVAVDGQPLTCYRGDGLIISSPTGSTAYSLSAGGPILAPSAAALLITPICPHTLTNRSIVISSHSQVEIKLVSRNVATIVSADGLVQGGLGLEESILVRRSRRALRLLRPGGDSFFDTVRKKLHWRGSNV